MAEHIFLIGGDDPFPRRLKDTLRAAAGAAAEVVEKPHLELTGTLAVYLAVSRGGGAPDLDDALAVFAELKATSIPRLVLLSSSAIFHPTHRHLGMVAENARPPAPAASVAAQFRDLEEQVRRMVKERLTVLRPCPVPVLGGADLWSDLFSRRPAVPWGFDPPLQVLSIEDLAHALVAVSKAPAGGTYHLAPEAPIALHRAFARSGRGRWPSPGFLLRRERADFLRYSFTVSAKRAARELDWQARYTSAEALDLNFARPLGKPERHDEFGQSREYIDTLGRTLLRFLHDVYWRVEARGLQHVPEKGRAVLVGIHRGFQPWDGVMILHLLARELKRYPRFLLHPTLIKMPFLAPFMLKMGGLPACRENAARVLEDERLLGIFPEGIRGAFSLYRNAYRLRRFGRDEFVRMALRHRAPIVPFVTVGSAEAFPIFAKIHWQWWKRVSEWPCLPVTVPLPLPSKWHTEFLEPLPVHEEHGPDAADDRAVVKAISAEVRRRLEASMTAMRRRRPSIFFGSAFGPER